MLLNRNEHIVSVLNNDYQQKMIIERLDSRLQDKWIEAREQYIETNNPPDDQIPFKILAEWIARQARILLQKEPTYRTSTSNTYNRLDNPYKSQGKTIRTQIYSQDRQTPLPYRPPWTRTNNLASNNPNQRSKEPRNISTPQQSYRR